MFKKSIGFILLVFTGAFNCIDWLGTVMSIPETFTHVHEFINSHHELGYQILPWGLMVLGLLLLTWPFPFALYTKINFNGIFNNKDNIKKLPFHGRVPLVDIYLLSTKYGIDFNIPKHSIGKFTQALRQAASDQKVSVWGRQRKHIFEAQVANEPLIKIPAEHWSNFLIEWHTASALGLSEGNNFAFRSFTNESTGTGFNDLHVNKIEAKKWLKSLNPNDLIY